MTLEERFWAKVQKTDGCWLWIGATTSNGYGCLRAKSRFLYAHRVSWEFHYGPVPEGMDVCHHCDNPPCIRPDHLFAGTDSENIKDAYRKGRKIPPPGHPKVTLRQIATIRLLYAEGVRQAMIGQQFSITSVQVSRIITGHRSGY